MCTDALVPGVAAKSVGQPIPVGRVTHGPDVVGREQVSDRSDISSNVRKLGGVHVVGVFERRERVGQMSETHGKPDAKRPMRPISGYPVAKRNRLKDNALQPPREFVSFASVLESMMPKNNVGSYRVA
jgi:hypothetical protein